MTQDRPRVPQDAEVKPPSTPNDRSGYQKCQDPLAAMPRICNPEAMSNDRGPAAEGVAHKIRHKMCSKVPKYTNAHVDTNNQPREQRKTRISKQANKQTNTPIHIDTNKKPYNETTRV